MVWCYNCGECPVVCKKATVLTSNCSLSQEEGIDTQTYNKIKTTILTLLGDFSTHITSTNKYELSQTLLNLENLLDLQYKRKFK